MHALRELAIQIVLLAIAGCNGQAASSPPSASGRGATASESVGGAEPLRVRFDGDLLVLESVRSDAPAMEAPGGEMVPGVPLPGSAARSRGDDDIPADRDGLLEAGRAALADGRSDEAAAMADVILIRNPDDTEALEVRGAALSRDGDAAGASRDFERCCRLGRQTCCRGGTR